MAVCQSQVAYTPVYKTHFFPPVFVSKSGCVLYMLLYFFKFKNALKSREIDHKHRVFLTFCLWLCNGEIFTKGSNCY